MRRIVSSLRNKVVAVDMAGQQGGSTQRGSVTLPQWPEHLVPCCLDMATSRPFPYAIDIIHITDYSTLDYYPSPRRFFEEVYPSSSAQTESVRRLSRSSIAPVVPLGRNMRSGMAQVVRDAQALTASTRRVSINTQPQRVEKVEVFLRPAGQVTVSAARWFSEPNTTGQNLSDDDRLFALHLPNQIIYMKPNSNSQRTLLIKYVQKWMRIASVPYFSSRIAFLVIDFTVTTSDAVDQGGRKTEKKKDYAADASAMQLKAATIALGMFTDAKHVVSESFVSNAQVQQYRSSLTGAAPSDRRRLVAAVPFSFGSQDMLSIGLRHESLGWLTPSQTLAVTLGQIIGLHRSQATAYHMPLFLQGAFQGKVRSWASVWWAPDQSQNLSIAFSCRNLVRSDFVLPDPACFVSLTVTEKEGSKRRRGRFVHFSEAYRNRKDAEFAPFSLSFPVDLPQEYRKSVNFVSDMPSQKHSEGGVERHLSRIFYHAIPLSHIERASTVTENDQFSRLEDGSNLGNDAVYPAITATDVLLFEVVDGHFDAIMRDCIPAAMGTTLVSVDDLLSVTNDSSGSSPGDPPLLSYALSMKPGLQLTESTPVSTLERLREKQKSKYPLSLKSFVFLSPNEVTEGTNSKVMSDKPSGSVPSTVKLGSCELGITKTTLNERPTFLQFLHSNAWDFGSMIFVDLTQPSLRAHRRTFLSVKQTAEGTGSSTELNVFETLIVIINRMLVPYLCRGGSDLYGFGSALDGQTSVFPMHQYPEAFGVAVDETTAVDRRMVSESPSHHGKIVGDAPTPRTGLQARGSATVPPFPILRDWNGELTLGTYRTKRAAVTAKYDVIDDAATEALGEGFSQLCPLLRRASQRTTSLASARSAAIERGATSIPSQSYQVVTIMIHSNIVDAVEAAHLIASWIERPIGFVLVFLDSTAPIVFGGIPNCLTVDFQCCQGKSLGGLALHRQLRTVEDTMSRVPSLFLAFARVTGILPVVSSEAADDMNVPEDDANDGVANASCGAIDAATDKEEEYKVERRKFVSTSQRFRNAFGGGRPVSDHSAATSEPAMAPHSPTQRRAQQSDTQPAESAIPARPASGEAHARIVDVYVPEEELVYLELESARQLARQRNLAAAATAQAPLTSKARSTVGRPNTQAPSQLLAAMAPTTLLDDALVRKHVDRLMAPKNNVPRGAEVDRTVDEDDEIVAVVMGRQETVNASEVAVMLQCDPADAQQLLSVTTNKGQSPNSAAPARVAPQGHRESSQLLSDIGDVEDSDGSQSEQHLSPREKRAKREKEELEQVVDDALKSMYKGWSKGLLDEVLQDAAEPQESEKKSPAPDTTRRLKQVDRFEIYKASDPVTDVKKYRTTNMMYAMQRAKTFGQQRTLLMASQTGQTPKEDANPPQEVAAAPSTEKRTEDTFVQELAPEKRKRLNELLLAEKSFHGGPALNAELARKQQEAAERRIEIEARLRLEQRAAAIASAPQKAKERQKRLQQWKAAFRKSNRVTDEDDPDVLV